MAAYILELPDDSLDGIIIWMFLLLAFFCVLLPIYELARRNPKFKHVYFTRNLDNSPSSFQLPNQFFSGFIEVFKIPQEEILSKLGIDALQYLRFLAMCFRIILALFVLMFGILIPIHYYAGAAIDVGGQLVNITNADMGLKLARDSLNSISIVNIKDGSPLLWIHLVFAYIVTGWTAYNLYWSYRDYTICYTKHMSSTSIHTASESLRNRTVMVKNMLPETMSILRTWLDSLKLGEIDSITMNTHGNQELYKLVEKRNRVIHLLEVAYMNWARSIYCHINKKQLTSIGPSINVLLHHQKIEDAFKDTYFLKQRPIFLGASLGTDAISHLKQQEEEMTSRIEALRATDSGTPIYSPFSFLGPRLSCFVTFKTRRASELAKQVLLTSDMSFHSMYMLTAPELDTVLWGNLGLSLTERNLRKFSITALGLVFALFWVIPTSLVSSLTDLPKLSDNPAFAGYIEYLSARPFLYTLVGQVGPPLIITIANSCAPYILECKCFIMQT